LWGLGVRDEDQGIGVRFSVDHMELGYKSYVTYGSAFSVHRLA